MLICYSKYKGEIIMKNISKKDLTEELSEIYSENVVNDIKKKIT